MLPIEPYISSNIIVDRILENIAKLKEIAVLCEINKPLTFHIARHTFATTITLTNGVPIKSISKMLGHTKLSTTQIYEGCRE